MVMAWTRLFHAHFNATIGDKFYYKNKSGRYETVDGEKKSWELSKCIKEYGALDKAVESNLIFFIKLRNKIEHRHIEKREIDTLIFGECQSFLYNYETYLIKFFGQTYSINESLVYSLQFSHIRTTQQDKANKSALSKDLADIVSFVDKYRTSLDDEIYNAQEYSIKLIQIPKISNTNRADAAVEFVRLDSLSAEDKAVYDQLTVLIKDKTVKVEAANVRRLKASDVLRVVNQNQNRIKLTQNLHVVLYKLFEVRPPNGSDDPFDTETEYCLYDETHTDYVYQDAWGEFLTHFLQTTTFTASELRQKEKNNETFKIVDYRM